MVMAVVNSSGRPGHTIVPSRRNPKVTACFHRTGVLLAFLVWNISIFRTVIVHTAFGAQPGRLDSVAILASVVCKVALILLRPLASSSSMVRSGPSGPCRVNDGIVERNLGMASIMRNKIN